MTTSKAATLESAQGQVVLEEVAIDAAVDDLMTVVDMRQSYRNPGTGHIEAVYTFPLPVEAVLLEFTVAIGDRKMAGTVVAKTEAERRYEDAITDGDAAVLLEQPQPGLYTASVGNLAPGETARVRFRYGLLLRWNGDLVRLAMPTTIAPRYGDPSTGGLHPHQQPEYGFDTERAFRMRVSVGGVLQGARWTSSSHDIAITPDGERTVIEIARPAAMDRDCVLEAHATVANARSAQLDRDDGDWVALASFRPEIPDLGESGAQRCVKMVVDCSGSMSGDSIEQVRVAGARILDSLRPGDLFDIVAFGSRHRALFGRAMPANRTNIARAREFVLDLDADLGGTEIASALRAAYRIESDHGVPRDLLLITDGEVWDTDSTVAEARASGHRIFSVGVGSAVAEPFVRALAAATGGACELVTPREDMAARIHRHFQRILAPPAKRARVIWPAPVRHAVPDPLPPPFPGDTLHLFGSFAERPEGPVVLELELADGRTVSHRLELGAPPPGNAGVEGASGIRSDLARLGAARRLAAIGEKAAATELAVRYQLVSEWTDCLVVHVRADADKAAELPNLVKVPQVLAAGWHGIGTVHDAPTVSAAVYGEAPPTPARSFSERVPGPSRLSPASRRLSRRAAQAADMEPLFDMVPPVSPATISSPAELVAALNHRSLPAVPTLEALAALGIPDELIAGLRALVDGGEDARAVAVIFLYVVCESPAGNGIDRHRRRLILSAYKKLRPRAAAVDAVRRICQDWHPFGGGAPA
ncbi:MAG: VIT and VWA domain-containing protein [Spirochaetaceae bacterium]|nr:VIT and VWA domain-containing protein [Spirochaetaceae bacterium]